jgi:uncharacterized protein YndB with AHSA1/START domain
VNDAEMQDRTQDIVVDEWFPHAPHTLWRALTSGELIARWLMAPTGFAPLPGTRFTFQTRPAGAWDGTIACEVLEAIPEQRLVYRWQGGHEDNAGYGSRLDTVVTWQLSAEDGGTRLRLIHAGFVVARNDTAYENMSAGWKKVVPAIGAIAAGLA